MLTLVCCLFASGIFITLCGIYCFFIKQKSAVLFFGLCLFLLSLVIFACHRKGSPVSLDVLKTGEKYEVVAIYEKYIIIKSVTDDEELKFIGPLDFGTVITGRYVKTAEESLVKIE